MMKRNCFLPFLVLGLLLSFLAASTRAADPALPDQPICIYWKVTYPNKSGNAYLFPVNGEKGGECITLSLTYKCLTPHGIETYSIPLKYLYSGLDLEPYTFEFEVPGAFDPLGNPIKGSVLTAVGNECVNFMIPGHTVVGGFVLNVKDWDWYYEVPGDPNNWWHSFDYYVWYDVYHEYEWTAPGWEGYLD